MADDGFDFHAPERRAAKRFEPPPWEKEAFEEFQRRRAEEQQAQATPATEVAGGPAKPEEVQAPSAEAELEGAESARPAGGEERQDPAAPAPVLEEARVTEMLAGLSAQEPRDTEGLWTVALGSAVVVGAIGGVLIVWAMAAFIGARSSGVTGLAGGAVLLFFGAGFVSSAVWLAYRTLRQRGVL